MKKITIRDVYSAVSTYTGISDISARDRTPDIAYARHLYCYFCRKKTKATWKKISTFLGRDHKTAFSSVKRLQNLFDTEDRVKNDVATIQGILNQIQ